MPSSSIEQSRLGSEAGAKKTARENTSEEQDTKHDVQTSHVETSTPCAQAKHKSDSHIAFRAQAEDEKRQFETGNPSPHNGDAEGPVSTQKTEKSTYVKGPSPESQDHLPHTHLHKLNGSNHSNNSNNSNTSNTSMNSSHSRHTTSTQVSHLGHPKKSQHSHTKLKSHNRSSSHNKISTNIPKSTVSNSAAANRPNLGRSKSTDGLIKSSHRNNNLKRNNRSLTKLSALQPLTRTISNQSMKSSLRPLTKTMSNQSIRSNKSNTSLKNLASGNNVVQLSGLKTSGRKGKAILRFNDDYKDDEYEEDVSEDSEDESRTTRHTVPPANFTQQQLQQLQRLQAANNNNYNTVGPDPNDITAGQNEPRPTGGPTAQIQSEPNLTKHAGSPRTSSISHLNETSAQTKSDSHVMTASQIKSSSDNTKPETSAAADENPTDISTEAKNNSTTTENNNQVPSSAQSSTDDLMSHNLYGGSLLLSQSTGLTKKIDAKASGPDQVFTSNAYNNGSIPVPRQTNQESLGSTNSESISGISFKANPIEKGQNNIAEPVTTNKTVAPANSYQPNQSIFNNLQRTNSQFTSAKKPQQFNNDANNFADFLKSGRSNNSNANGDNYHFQGHGEASSHGTRTQQRLWLQRENSLMDVSGADPYKMSTLSNMSLNKLMINPYGSSTNVRDISTPNSLPGINGTPTGASGPTSSLTPTVDSNASMSNINGLFLMAQNRHQNPIQSRTEFERLNREYLNVRRHLNPVAETLTRVDEILSHTRTIDPPKRKEKKGAAATLSSLSLHSSSNNVNSFKEFSPLYQEKEDEVSKTIDKMWNEALLENSSTNNPARSSNQQRGAQQHQFQQHQFQQQQMQQLQQSRDLQYAQQQQHQQQQQQQQQSGFMPGNIRTQQPTTRKLAAQAAAQQKQQRLRGGVE